MMTEITLNGEVVGILNPKAGHLINQELKRLDDRIAHLESLCREVVEAVGSGTAFVTLADDKPKELAFVMVPAALIDKLRGEVGE